MTTNFLEALQTLAASQLPKQTPAKPLPRRTLKPQQPIQQPVQQPVQQPAPQLSTPRIDLVVNKNRIDLTFDGVPTKETRELIRVTGGFWFSAERQSWYNKDTPQVRQFLQNTFNAVFEEEKPKTEASSSPLETRSEPSLSSDMSENSPFERYKKQTLALCETLKIDAADLALVAVDELYKKIFN